MPTREWSLNRLMRSTISALPTTKPMRHPAIPYVFDIDHISTPTSFAPAVDEEALRSPLVEHDVDVGGVVHDRAAGSARPCDRVVEDAVGRTDRARIRRIVEVERRRRGCRGQVRRPAVLRAQRERSRYVRRRARGPMDSRGSTGPVRSNVSPSSQRASASSTIAGLRAGDERHFRVGIERDAVHVAIARRDRLARRREPANRRVAVHAGLERRRAQRLDRRAAAGRSPGCRDRGRGSAGPPRRPRPRSRARAG